MNLKHIPQALEAAKKQLEDSKSKLQKFKNMDLDKPSKLKELEDAVQSNQEVVDEYQYIIDLMTTSTIERKNSKTIINIDDAKLFDSSESMNKLASKIFSYMMNCPEDFNNDDKVKILKTMKQVTENACIRIKD